MMNCPHPARRPLRLTIATAAWCWLLVWLVPASGCVRQLIPVVVPDLQPQPYLDVIEQYRRGDVAPAVEALRSWTAKGTEKAVIALMTRRTPALQIPDVPAMYAAAMLHTDAAITTLEIQGNSEASFHLRAAADLLMWTVLKVPDQRRWLFSRRDWRLMATRVLNHYIEWNVYQSSLKAHDWAPKEVREARATETIEGDADMELAVGSLAEGFAFMNAQELKIDQDGAQRALVLQLRPRAEGHFRRALSLESNMIEARLRLGRVLLDQDRAAEAKVELGAVLKAAADPRTLHLALLFLGEAAEKAGRFEEATGLYRRAVNIKPDCQAARVALAYATERMGEMDRARSVVAWFLGRNQPWGVPMDDWTSYPGGQYTEGFEALARLRTSVVRK